MNAKIFLKDGRWNYSFRENGATYTRLCKNCKTEAEAKKFVSKLNFEKNSQYLIKNIAADMYLEDSEHMRRQILFGRHRSKLTINQKRKYIELIIKEFGNEKITRLNIQKVQLRLLDDEHSSSWKNIYLEVFMEIFDETIFKCSKPVSRPPIQKFSRQTKPCNIFSTEELERLFKPLAWRDYDSYLFFRTLYSCGLRLGEMRGLRVKQILFEQQSIVIDGFCLIDGTRTNYNKKGSEENRKIRVAPIQRETLDLLDEYIKSRKRTPDDFVFQKDGKPFRSELLRKRFRTALKTAHIETTGRKLVPHSLRYTYVTRMRRTLDIESVQKIVGHTTEKMTEYYTKFEVQDLIAGLKHSIPSAEKLFE